MRWAVGFLLCYGGVSMLFATGAAQAGWITFLIGVLFCCLGVTLLASAVRAAAVPSLANGEAPKKKGTGCLEGIIMIAIIIIVDLVAIGNIGKGTSQTFQSVGSSRPAAPASPATRPQSTTSSTLQP